MNTTLPFFTIDLSFCYSFETDIFFSLFDCLLTRVKCLTVSENVIYLDHLNASIIGRSH